MELKIEDQWLWAEYDNMTIESETNKYRLHVTGYHGNADDALNNLHSRGNFKSNGRPFSTLDVDNDLSNKGNCAARRLAGWWYARGSSSCLNCVLAHAKWHTGKTQKLASSSRMLLQCGGGI